MDVYFLSFLSQTQNSHAFPGCYSCCYFSLDKIKAVEEKEVVFFFFLLDFVRVYETGGYIKKKWVLLSRENNVWKMKRRR